MCKRSKIVERIMQDEYFLDKTDLYPPQDKRWMMPEMDPEEFDDLVLDENKDNEFDEYEEDEEQAELYYQAQQRYEFIEEFNEVLENEGYFEQ